MAPPETYHLGTTLRDSCTNHFQFPIGHTLKRQFVSLRSLEAHVRSRDPVKLLLNMYMQNLLFVQVSFFNGTTQVALACAAKTEVMISKCTLQRSLSFMITEAPLFRLLRGPVN